MSFGAGRKDRKITVPAFWQFAPLHLANFHGEVGVLSLIVGEELRPPPPRLCAARADAIREMLAHSIGNKKLRVLWPAVKAFDEADFFFAERLAMGCRRVVFMWRTVADVAIENDEGWPSLGLAKHVQGIFNEAGVVGVAYAQNIPAIALKPASDIFSESDAGACPRW